METYYVQPTSVEFMVNVINYFFVPFLSVAIYSRRHKEKVRLSFLWLMRYAVFTVLTYLFTNIGVLAVRFFFHREIFQASVRYTIAALCVAFVLPFLVDILGAAFSFLSFHADPRT